MLIDGKYEVKKETQTHWLCLCPYCFERGCKEDKTGKLSISKNLGIGQCWRCSYKYFNKEAKLNLLNNENKPVQKKYSEFDISAYTPIIKNSNEYEYLKEKRNLSDESIKVYNLRSIIYNGKRGILIPNQFIRENVVDYFQVRFIEGNSRYYNLANTDKPLQGILGLSNRSKLVICEGLFNSISVRQSTTSFDSLALQGKAMTPTQEKQLVSLLGENWYDEIIIALDYGYMKEVINLFEVLKSLTSTRLSFINFKDERDFNEMQSEEINQLLNDRMSISVDNIKTIKTLFLRNNKNDKYHK